MSHQGDTFVLTVNTAGEAFDQDLTGELRRLLLVLADKLEEGSAEGTLRDLNGNTCGLFGFEPGGGRG